MNSSESRPVNLGNGDEFTTLEFAHWAATDIAEDVVQRAVGIASPRRVDITVHDYMRVCRRMTRRSAGRQARAEASLDWQRRWTERTGLRR